MLHATPRTREGQRTKVTKEVCGTMPDTRESRKYVTCHGAHARRTTNKGNQRGVWNHAGHKQEVTHATAEKSAHTCTPGQGGAARARAHKGVNQDRPNEESKRNNPRPHTLACTGSTTAPRHASHETIRVRSESRKYVTCHAAHTRGATNEKNKKKRCGHIPSSGASASMLHTTLARPAPTTETNKGVGPTREQGE